MNSDALKMISKIAASGDIYRDASEFGLAKNEYEHAIEALEKQKPEELTEEDKKFLKTLKEKSIEMDEKLAYACYEKGKAAVYSKSWELAIENFEEAIRLASVDNIQFLERAKKQLDKAKAKGLDYKIYQDINSLVERGNDFKNSGNYAEAILEFEDAYKVVKNLPEDHKYVVFVKNEIKECRRNLVRPYLSRIYKAYHKNKFSEAASEMKRALTLIDSSDDIYRKFLESIQNKITSYTETESETNDSEEIANSEEWDKAVKDYEEALDLYSSFSVTDPIAPAYSNSNIYEDRFVEAKRNLGILYKKRADTYRDTNKPEKALKNYKEALKLLPRNDKFFHESFEEIKNLRTKLSPKY